MASNPNLAQTTFSAGPDDTLATIDAYSKTIVDTIYNNKDITNIDISLDKISSVIGLNKKDLNTLIQLLKTKKLNLSLADITTRLFGSNPALLSLFKTIDKAIQAKFNINQILNGKIRLKIGSTYFVFKRKDFKSISAIGDLIKTYTTGKFNTTLTDMPGLTGAVTSMLQENSRVGAPSAYKALMDGKDKYIVSHATSAVLPSIVKYKDVHVLKEISEGIIAKEVIPAYPDLIKHFIDGPIIPAWYKETRHREVFNTLVSTFQILDPNWNKCVRNGVTILDLHLICPGSKVKFQEAAQTEINNSLINFGAIVSPVTNLDAISPSYSDDKFFYPLVKSLGSLSAEAMLKANFPTVSFKANPQLEKYNKSPFI